MIRVAIHQKKEMFDHSTVWSSEWKEYCASKGIEVEMVDGYRHDFMDRMDHFDVLLWHLSPVSQWLSQQKGT